MFLYCFGRLVRTARFEIDSELHIAYFEKVFEFAGRCFSETPQGHQERPPDVVQSHGFHLQMTRLCTDGLPLRAC